MKLTRHQRTGSHEDYWVAQSEDFPVAAESSNVGDAAEKLNDAIRTYLSYRSEAGG